MIRHRLIAVGSALTLALSAGPVRAQTAAGRMLEAARTHIDNLMWDSAAALLQTTLDPRTGATDAERVRGFTLLGLAELSRDNRNGARQAFEQALRIDRDLSIDSLAALHSDAKVAFAEARSELGIVPVARVAPPLTLRLDTPSDTTVPATDGRLRILAEPSAPARVVLTIAPVDAPQTVLWSGELAGAGPQTTGWSLRGGDSALVAAGRYALRASATDSFGQVSPTIERVLIVTRAAPDTSQLPSPPLPSDFLPESVSVRRGTPRNLIVGLLFGAAATLLPVLNTTGNPVEGGGAVIAGGTVTLAGVIGFLAGHHNQPSPTNARRNQELREQYARSRAAALTQAAERAPVRVRVEGVGR